MSIQEGSVNKVTDERSQSNGTPQQCAQNGVSHEEAGRNEDTVLPTDNGPAQPRVVVDPTKDLWTNIALNTRENAVSQTEVNLLVVGTSGGGKSSVLQRFLAGMNISGSSADGRAHKVKPTTALDYSFARRNDRHVTQMAHLWELAQGMELSQLCEVVITPENVHATLLAIVVDCSEPSTMWETVAYWLKRIDRRVLEISQKMRAKGSSTPEKLVARAKQLVGLDHPDLDRLRLSGVPAIIICNKLDAFPGDMELLKRVTRCMRFIAHIYGAYLVFTGETDTTKLRALMNHVIFLTTFDLKHIELDPDRGAVLVVPNVETFTDIGEPMVCDMSNFHSTGDAELDRWKAPFDAVFPAKKPTGRLQSDSSFLKRLYDTSENGFGEPLIDSVRKQKDEELEQYRKSAFARERATKEDKGKTREKKRERDY